MQLDCFSFSFTQIWNITHWGGGQVIESNFVPFKRSKHHSYILRSADMMSCSTWLISVFLQNDSANFQNELQYLTQFSLLSLLRTNVWTIQAKNCAAVINAKQENSKKGNVRFHIKETRQKFFSTQMLLTKKKSQDKKNSANNLG